MLAKPTQFGRLRGGKHPILPPKVPNPMGEPVDRTARRPERERRSAVMRVFANASLLAFASLCVISLATARFGAALLWGGALLVFFAPALDRTGVANGPRRGGRRVAPALSFSQPRRPARRDG